MAEEKTCKATLYSESPGFLIPKNLKDLVMPREDSMGKLVGHVFFGITDETGKEEIYGFHTSATAPENVDKPFKEKKSMIFGQKIAGFIADDSKEPYDDKLVYKITKEQYDKIKNHVEEQKKNPPKYGVFSCNCVHFAYKALKKAELKLPPQPLLHMPATVCLSARAYEKARSVKKALKKATGEILAGFSATKKLSEKLLASVTKVKDMDPFGIRSVANSVKDKMVKVLHAKHGR